VEPEELNQLRRAVEGLTFTFAKTMPETPHWYVVRAPVNEAVYVQLFTAIHAHGYTGRWRGTSRKYLELGDGFKYWAMTTHMPSSRIINRDETLRSHRPDLDFSPPAQSD
jgi:hypothetical protein